MKILQGGYVILDIVFGCDYPINNLNPVGELSFLTQFVRHYKPAVLSFGEVMQGGLTNRGRVYEE